MEYFSGNSLKPCMFLFLKAGKFNKEERPECHITNFLLTYNGQRARLVRDQGV